MRSISLLTIMLATLCLANAQQVSNAHFEQDGFLVKVFYDLSEEANVNIYLSTDGGQTYESIIHVRGSVGDHVAAGKQLCAVWDVFSDRDRLQGDSICFKVYAYIDRDLDREPEFPGGVEELIKFVTNNIVYPQEAKDNNVVGRVFVEFIIEKDGSVSNVRAARDIGGGCGDEAVRVIKLMPRWIPGKRDGKTVRAAYTLSIVFDLPLDN